MNVKLIQGMGKELDRFLGEFDDCFGRSEPREHLRTYVRGQLSDLKRKSVEPIALAGDVPPRTLQEFLNAVRWDEQRMRDRIQHIVARDHADPRAIGVIDETGNPKKGRHTAGVQRQWCGRTGNVDNCVVAVHLGYVVGDFQCLLDSDIFLPEEWANDLARRAEAKIPPEVMFRTKLEIALSQVQRALANGIRVAAWTFDSFYGRAGAFLDRMDALGQNYVGEVPSDFCGWLRPPVVLSSPRPQELRRRGNRWKYPRVSRKTSHVCEVRNLCEYSPIFREQEWQRFRIKDGEKGPVVWEIKYSLFYRKHGPHGLPGPAHTLIVARNVLNPAEVKYFVSNMAVGSGGVTLEWLLWVAFSRWPIERCFQVGKSELGMDHFEVRSWAGIHRHLYISQLSQLLCGRIHQRLREKNDREFVPDRGTDSHSGFGLGRSSVPAAIGPCHDLQEGRKANRLLPGPEPAKPHVPYEDDAPTPPGPGHKGRPTAVLCAGGPMTQVAL
jgi:SRSO17 transposase